jgi:peptide chain release factor 2
MFDIEAAKVDEMAQRLHDLRKCLNVEGANKGIAGIEQEMAASDFWDDPESAQKVVQKLKILRNAVNAPEEMHRNIEDAKALVDLAREAEDETMGPEIAQSLEELEGRLARLELASLFNDPRDTMNVILNIHPGAGGTESCDWADMLYRMILRFCERRDFVAEVVDFLPGEEAGLKSATVRISGPYAYGNFKSESGVHRLVRISPFDAAKRRHTSFAAIEVLPEIDDTIEVEIREEDIRMDMYRSGGAGGQKVNKTSSAVRLTHIPTGVVVACQIERSHHRNRAVAMQLLRAKLYDMEQKKKEAEMMQARSGQQDVAWGSQIRSYVLCPYQLIKDHRTNFETGNVDRVLDGELDAFIESFLKWELERRRRD